MDIVERLRTEAALPDNLWRTVNNAKNAIDEMLRAKRMYEPYDAIVVAREDLAEAGSSMREAADLIAALREALKPFAETADGIPDSTSDSAPIAYVNRDRISPGTMRLLHVCDFRRARSLLSPARKEE